jgi:hypothetical protein
LKPTPDQLQLTEAQLRGREGERRDAEPDGWLRNLKLAPSLSPLPDHDDEVRAAYMDVVDGYERALNRVSPENPRRATLQAMLCQARVCAGLPPVEAAEASSLPLTETA